MNTQLIHASLVKTEMDGSCVSCKSKSCDVCTDKTSGYRLRPKDSLNKYQNTYVIRTSIRGGNNNYDKQRYAYQRERISCLLCASMICRLKHGSTSDFERL